MSDNETNNEGLNKEQGTKPAGRKAILIISSALIVIVIAAIAILWKTNVLKGGKKPFELISGSGPAIIIGDKTISKKELNKELNLQVALLKEFSAAQGKPFDPYSKQNANIINELKQNVIQGLISLNLLLGYAKQNGITVTDTDVNNTLSGLESKFGKVKFEKILNESGMSEDEIRKQVKDQLVARQVFLSLEKGITVSDADAQAFYEKHKAEFTVPQEVDVRHILVKTQAEAEQIEKELKRGVPFTTLAMEKSIDKASAVKGGDVGFFPEKGAMVPAFSEAAFALKKPGQISPIVHTQFGYHIIQLVAKKAAEKKDFKSVKDMIKQMLVQQKAKDAFETLINALKAKTKIETKV